MLSVRGIVQTEALWMDVVESFCRSRKRADVRDWNIVSALASARLGLPRGLA
jgi:hypothetical protein